MSLLQVDNITYQYTKDSLPVIKNLTFELDRRTMNVLIGPSGIGKTTLINIIAGYYHPTIGSAKMSNQIINTPSWKRNIVFQDMALFPWLTVKQNILFGPKIRHQVIPDLTQILEQSKLSEYIDQYIYQLSGGLKQRVALARAFVNKPELLILDESFGSLDNYTRQEMHQLLFDLWEQTENCVLIITHDIDEALFLGQNIFVMNNHPGTITAKYTNKFFRHSISKFYNNLEYLKLRQQLLLAIK